MSSKYRLKVGIDFGTTFSGISWITTMKPDEVNVVKKWPGATRDSTKVPSEILYTPDGAVKKWGYQIKFPDQPIAWFKLLLYPDPYAFADTSMVAGTRGQRSQKKPVEIVADYLTCLRHHFLQTIAESLGQAFLSATAIDYTLTVPAIWNDAAKALTIQAAEKAGLGNKETIRLMSEPDAAAAWTLLRDIAPNKLKVGEAFVVVDCGGGTVDLISYRVETLNPLTVNECVKGTGGLCGSVFLNEGFTELVKSRIGARLTDMKPAIRNRMMNEWEQVLKREFSNSPEDDLFSCPVGLNLECPKMRIMDGELLINREEMLGIFDPVIDQIIELVQAQLDMVAASGSPLLRISAILLVGGFGQSDYLRQRLERDLMEGSESSKIEILQPTNGWSAVSRGAALGIHISSRKARRHYGVVCAQPFIHGHHPLKNITYDEFSGEAMCKDSIMWFIKKYDHVSEGEPISIPFFHTVWFGQSLQFTSKVINCDEDEAPVYTNEVNSALLGQSCTAHCNLSAIPKELFEIKRSLAGQFYYDIAYNLVMTIRSGDVHFGLEFDGKNYGTAVGTYE